MRPKTAATLLQVFSKPSMYDTYRGVIRVHLDTGAPTLDVINELTMEAYLRGVVPSEMPSTWPAAALRVQAIAASSYAARRIRGTDYTYDVSDDTSSQVYQGQEGEHVSTDDAIEATAGVVRKSGSLIANTLFHSAGGGATEHNENVFVSSTGAKVAGPVSYLRGSADRRPDGTAYDDASPYATWATRAYSRTQLSAWFATDPRTNVGTLRALDLRDRGVSGRLISVRLIGSAGFRQHGLRPRRQPVCPGARPIRRTAAPFRRSPRATIPGGVHGAFERRGPEIPLRPPRPARRVGKGCACRPFWR
jgi:stage II sporulation protein D